MGYVTDFVKFNLQLWIVELQQIFQKNNAFICFIIWLLLILVVDFNFCELCINFYLFYSRVESPLAMLYSTSVMEHHHFDHCIMILNSEVNLIQYSQFYSLLVSEHGCLNITHKKTYMIYRSKEEYFYWCYCLRS